MLVAAIAGYALAITLAKSSAPKQTVYDLPHDFRVTDATFLPSALPGSLLTTGNRIEILENGDGIFPPMLEAIAAAKKTVDFEAYIFWSGTVGSRFRDALAERATHGVEVRILLDAVGSPGRKLKAADVEVLKRAGCRVEFFHSRRPWKVWVVNHRNHRRVLVVDGAVGFTGGAGFADEWSGNADSPEHWRDTQVRVGGTGRARAAAGLPGELVGSDGRSARRRGVLSRDSAGGLDVRGRRAVVAAGGDVGGGKGLRRLARRGREGDLDRQLVLPAERGERRA